MHYRKWMQTYKNECVMVGGVFYNHMDHFKAFILEKLVVSHKLFVVCAWQ